MVAFLVTGVFLFSSLVAGMASEGDYKLLDSPTEKAVSVTKITAELSGGPDSDDNFTGDARNAKIERELNQVYTALMHKLDPAAQEQLREEQRGWLKERDAFVEKFGQTFDISTEMENRRIVLDRSLRAFTEKRVAALRQRE
jgi:uncharacterized protein YecT (DUF1311 family)